MKSNKPQSDKVNIYSSINDLIIFKIANFELNYAYKTELKKNLEYENYVKRFLEREIINYACRRSPVLSDSFWDEDFNESLNMKFRFEGHLKNSKIKVIDERTNKPPITALKNLKKIEFFTMQTMLEAEAIRRTRDFDIIHSYIVDTQKRLRAILDSIIVVAIVDWRKELRVNQPSIQKNLIIHLFHLDRLNFKKPELSQRIRKCITKDEFSEKSDCKTPYFYANKLEENKYCSKKCKINFQNFQDMSPHSKNITKKVKRKKADQLSVDA